MNNPEWIKATRKKPLGKHSPWVWPIEFVRGCNLRCWHCAARVFPEDGKPRFMSRSIWESLCKVIAGATPNTRLELAQTGEPTLHPHLLECIRMAREITPTTQLQVTTNGKTLMTGRVTYKEMFDAGANSVYVDMYDPFEKHRDLVKKTGFEWYKYDKPGKVGTEGHRKANTYYGDPDMKLIILQDCPENRVRWRNTGRLATWLNCLDWEAAIPYGLVPVRETYKRKCTIPMRLSTVNYEGYYQFCCVDFRSESAGLMGNVNEGIESFKRYWFGRLMQSIRRRLANKDRACIPYCSRCNCAFSKCDWIGLWPEGSFEKWWDGKRWLDLPSLEDDIEVFADGWDKAKVVQAGLPSEEYEMEILKKSTKRIIKSTAAIDKSREKRKKIGFGLC